MKKLWQKLQNLWSFRCLNSSVYIQVLGLKMKSIHSPLSNSATTSRQITQSMNADVLIRGIFDDC